MMETKLRVYAPRFQTTGIDMSIDPGAYGQCQSGVRTGEKDGCVMMAVVQAWEMHYITAQQRRQSSPADLCGLESIESSRGQRRQAKETKSRWLVLCVVVCVGRIDDQSNWSRSSRPLQHRPPN